MASTIRGILAREILDSRGNPTVEVDLVTHHGFFRASVPTGPGSGSFGARELRDNDRKRMLGRGVLKAVDNINNVIAPKLLGMDATQQATIDKYMAESLDGSTNEGGWSKSKLGANAVLAVSMAVCRAGAAANDLEPFEYIAKLAGKQDGYYALPMPAFNMISGGTKANNRLACQEFMLVPVGAETFKEAMTIGVEVYHTLKKVIHKRYGQQGCNVADDGSFTPPIGTNLGAFDVLMEALELSGHLNKVKIAVDAAASEFFDDMSEQYDLDFKSPLGSEPQFKKTRAQLLECYRSWTKKYPIISIEDPFDTEDWTGLCHMTGEMGTFMQVVGDRVLESNPAKVFEAAGKKACNSLLLKMTDVGCVSDALQVAKLAYDAGWSVVVSSRPGETEDSFIADLALGLATGQIKAGAPCRSEHIAKYNRLIRMEEDLGKLAIYAGRFFRDPANCGGGTPSTCDKSASSNGG